MITKPKKYTNKWVLNEVKELHATLIANPEIIFLGELFEKKPYSLQRFSEWNKLGGEISETIEIMKTNLLTRAVVGGLKNKLNASITKFHLTNNFNWRDKTETDMTTQGEKIGGINYVVPKVTEHVTETTEPTQPVTDSIQAPTDSTQPVTHSENPVSEPQTPIAINYEAPKE